MALNVPQAHKMSGKCEHMIKSFKVNVCERHTATVQVTAMQHKG